VPLKEAALRNAFRPLDKPSLKSRYGRNRDLERGRHYHLLSSGGKADLNGRHQARCRPAAYGPNADWQLQGTRKALADIQLGAGFVPI
jgi:hypothetical protein